MKIKNWKISNINQKTLIPFIYSAIILIWMDGIITVVGLKLGLEENNFISLMFMNILGNFYGLIASITGKSVIVIFPMITYQYVHKELETIFLKKTYNMLYMVLIIITILTTLMADINNIIEIINKLQYQAWVHSLSELDVV